VTESKRWTHGSTSKSGVSRRSPFEYSWWGHLWRWWPLRYKWFTDRRGESFLTSCDSVCHGAVIGFAVYHWNGISVRPHLTSSKHTCWRHIDYWEKHPKAKHTKHLSSDCTWSSPLPRPPGTSPRVLIRSCADRLFTCPPECSYSFLHSYNLKWRERVHARVERVIHEVVCLKCQIVKMCWSTMKYNSTDEIRAIS